MSGGGEVLGRAVVHLDGDLGPLQQSLAKGQALTRDWLQGLDASVARVGASASRTGTQVAASLSPIDRAAMAGQKSMAGLATATARVEAPAQSAGSALGSMAKVAVGFS